ncbi:unnamed protein product [Cuscuta campestris]|uniref:Uncharacterized protein n=1 Tax=Cuscuta campestris TaxID=132261 RepID=A0A484MUN2_9ASTE|nr:unnamed protein product [Cuscuta campestris]
MQKIMDEDRFLSPSFNSCYSSVALAGITDNTSDDHGFPPPPPVGSVAAEHGEEEEEEEDDDEDDFEFSFVRENFDAFPGGFVYDGQIGSVFPVFNRDLLLDEGFRDPDRGDEGKALRESSAGISSLKNLFLDEQPQSSSSSSDADELDCVPPGTYCVWRPKKIDESPSSSLGKKSSSTGSHSMPRRIRDLLCRVNSHGNDRYVFLTPKTGETSKAANRPGVETEAAGKTQAKKKKSKSAAAAPPMAAHEAFYLRSKAAKEGEKRKSYLPYRRELVGFFANVKPAAFGKI